MTIIRRFIHKLKNLKKYYIASNIDYFLFTDRNLYLISNMKRYIYYIALYKYRFLKSRSYKSAETNLFLYNDCISDYTVFLSVHKEFKKQLYIILLTNNKHKELFLKLKEFVIINEELKPEQISLKFKKIKMYDRNRQMKKDFK